MSPSLWTTCTQQPSLSNIASSLLKKALSTRGATFYHRSITNWSVMKLMRCVAAEIITPSHSAWYFLIVIARKKEGKETLFGDYRKLNRRMKADPWPLPKIEEILTTFPLFACSRRCACSLDTGKFECLKNGKKRVPLFLNTEFTRLR